MSNEPISTCTIIMLWCKAYKNTYKKFKIMILKKGTGIDHSNKKLGNNMNIMHSPALANLSN